MSRELLAQTIEYENQLLSLQRTAQRHNQSVRDWAKASVTSTSTFSANAAMTASAEDTTEQIARVGFTRHQVRAYVADYLEKSRQRALQLQSVLADIDARARQTVSALKRDLKPLAGVRAKLEKLQQGPSLNEQLSTLRPILDAMKELFQDSNEGAK